MESISEQSSFRPPTARDLTDSNTMNDLTATYSPGDNKLRLYTGYDVDQETHAFARLRSAGFSWFPEQQLFVATGWTPKREDLLIEFCSTIGAEDKPLPLRSGERAERIRKLEAKNREMQNRKARAETLFKAWRKDGLTVREVKKLIHSDPESAMSSSATKPAKSMWAALRGFFSPKPSAEQLAKKAILRHWATVASTTRWIEHYEHRLRHERAMFAKQNENSPENTSAISSGIQTMRGPLSLSQQKLFKPNAGQSQNQGIGL